MRAETERAVEAWWRAVFGVGDALWADVTITHPHELLGDYPGWYVAWRRDGVHVSAPSTADPAELDALAANDLQVSRDPAFWQAFARQRRLELLGPSTHHLLDVAPDLDRAVDQIEPAGLDELRGRVSPAQWDESGLAHTGQVCFGLRLGRTLVAAAGLDEWDGAPRDVGVLVAPDHRGRGFGTRVGAHAAAHAVREHGRARWRALDTNLASTRAATRLGFEPYATQLAVRRR